MRDKRYVVHSKKSENSETTTSAPSKTAGNEQISPRCSQKIADTIFIRSASYSVAQPILWWALYISCTLLASLYHQRIGSILTLKKWQPPIQNATGMRMKPSTVIPPANAMTFHSHFRTVQCSHLYRARFCIFGYTLCAVSGWQWDTPTEMTVSAYAVNAWTPSIFT